MADEPGLRERIVARAAIGDHEGASGAGLERADLDDGRVVILKSFDPSEDLTMLISGRSVPLEVELWRNGTLASLPPALGHAVLDAWQESGTWVEAMEDLSDDILSYDSRLSLDVFRRLFAAANEMHEAFRDVRVEGLWPWERRVTAFAPAILELYAASDNQLPRWALEGWEAFDAVVPADVRETVQAVLADPGLLARPLADLDGATLLHGDYWTTNLALRPDKVVAIDWALASWGPPVAEFVSFLVGCSEQVDAPKEALIDEYRRIADGRADQRVVDLGLLAGLVELGWNLAWYVIHEPAEARQRELDWWVAAARRAMATGLLG